MRRYWSLLLLLICLHPVQAQENVKTCPDSLPPQLVVGEAARVAPGEANNVRNRPETSGELIGQIPGGALFTVLAGPACGDGFTWWQVQYGDLVGWTVEGNEDYWLEPLEGMTLYHDEFIRFAYNDELLTGLTYEHVEEEPTNRRQNSPYPEQIWYSFDTWPEISEYRPPRIRIARVDDITEEFPHHYPVVNELQVLLDEQPTNMLRVETPVTAAAQIGIAKPTYFDFVNGSGLVYVTGYAQDIAPFYVDQYEFAGLTNDGEYYVWGSFPLQLTFPDDEFDRSEYAEFNEETLGRYDEYVAQTVPYWNEQPDDTFEPNLAELRRVLETIEILGF